MQWASQGQTPDQNYDGATSDFEIAASRTTYTKSTKGQLSYDTLKTTTAQIREHLSEI
jgi:hypothetical protein